MLICFTARLWVHSQDFTVAEAWRRIVFGLIVAVLVVVAASILTKMRIEYFTSIERFVSSQRKV